jgi:hypothetical protein
MAELVMLSSLLRALRAALAAPARGDDEAGITTTETLILVAALAVAAIAIAAILVAKFTAKANSIDLG